MTDKNLLFPLFAGLLAAAPLLAQTDNELQDTQALDPGRVVYLEQNWDDDDRQWFYYINQGSRLLPWDVFLNIEQPDSTRPLREPLNMLRYGFMAGKQSKYNPAGLAIGIARDDDYMGLTCAACHTQQIRFNGKFIHIDGGQAMLDLPLFLEDIEKSLKATLEDRDKLQRFIRRVHGENAGAVELNRTSAELQSLHRIRKRDNARNRTTSVYGYSRLDAFGAILNKALLLTGVADNYNEPNAPTSYPYLWDSPQHDYVEWDGSQSNSDIGALARNVGEVIGVFGEVEPVPVSWLGFYDAGYASSIKTRNLRAIEKHVATLQSPLWPALFPAIDPARVSAGRRLYEKYCLSCHLDMDRTDPERKIKVRMSTLDTIGTDPLMALNAIYLRGKTGIFAGQPRFYSVGAVLGEEEPALFIVNNLMGGVLTNNPLQSLLAIRDAEQMGHPQEIHPPKYVNGTFIKRGEEVSDRALSAYKARPLNGIWSSAPFLHNGSVPNLYELLLPAERRSKQFYIGAWDYDPVKVGYVDEYRPGSFLLDTSLPGNSNAGHEYGTGYDGLPVLTEEEIWALVEYMKTL